MTEGELAWIAGALGARGLVGVEPMQGLWGAWGALVRVELEGGPIRHVIVKSSRPPARARESARAHARKLRSYAVEVAFYRDWAARCPAARTARLLAERVEGDRTTLVLEDLATAGFRHLVADDASPAELDPCLAWLAALHACFVGEAAQFPGLWGEGTYWHLATRPDELARTVDPELRAAASALDARLGGVRFRTLLHGDPKEANFLAASDGAVAAVDFQYAGGGCGMRDVAYLLGGRPSAIAGAVEAWGLDVYFGHLRSILGDERARAIEAEWRPLYPVAWLDFQRFLAGWAGEAWARDSGTRERVRRELRANA